MFESVLDDTLVEGGVGVPEKSWAIWLVLAELSLEVCTIAIEDLSVSFLHAVAKGAHVSVAIAVQDLCVSIKDALVPVAIDLDFPRSNLVCAPSMPEILLPLSLVHFLGVSVMVGPGPMT